MAWSTLASNQMVSYTDAQGGGFTLQSGQSSVTSNQCMTKADATTKYVLSSTPLESYASNQLIPKSAWVSGAVTPATLKYRTIKSPGATGTFVVYRNGTAIATQTSGTTQTTVTLSAGDTVRATLTMTSGVGEIDYYFNGVLNTVYAASVGSPANTGTISISVGQEYRFDALIGLL